MVAGGYDSGFSPSNLFGFPLDTTTAIYGDVHSSDPQGQEPLNIPAEKGISGLHLAIEPRAKEADDNPQNYDPHRTFPIRAVMLHEAFFWLTA